MKTKSIFICFTMLAGLLTSCDLDSIKASNDVTIETANVSNYSGLKVSNEFNAYVTFSDTEEKIEIEANDNLHRKIVVEKDGDYLVVKMKRHTIVRGRTTLNVFITTKNINKFNASGDSQIQLNSPLTTSYADINLSGDSYFSGELFVENLKIDAKGNSEASIFGTVDRLNVELKGASELKDYDLEVDDLIIELRGASDARLTANNTIDIEARGDSRLRYKGNADVTHQNLSGNSKVIHEE